jgi:hypothetical protein
MFIEVVQHGEYTSTITSNAFKLKEVTFSILFAPCFVELSDIADLSTALIPSVSQFLSLLSYTSIVAL